MVDPAVVVAKLVRYCGNALNVALRRFGVAWSPLLALRLLRLFRYARSFLRLHRWLSQHRPSCLGPAAINLLVDSLGRAHRLDALRRVVVGHSSPSIRMFAIAAEPLVSAGRSDLAVRLFLDGDRSRARVQPGPMPRPSYMGTGVLEAPALGYGSHYSRLLTVLARLGDLQKLEYLRILSAEQQELRGTSFRWTGLVRRFLLLVTESFLKNTGMLYKGFDSHGYELRVRASRVQLTGSEVHLVGLSAALRQC